MLSLETEIDGQYPLLKEGQRNSRLFFPPFKHIDRHRVGGIDVARRNNNPFYPFACYRDLAAENILCPDS